MKLIKYLKTLSILVFSTSILFSCAIKIDPLDINSLSAKDITEFSIPGAVGIIDGTDITVAVAFGTDVTALEPTIVTTGESVSPASQEAQDFTAPVVYTVTALDSSTKDYTVTVNIALNPSKDINGFAITGASELLIGTDTISLTVPHGTNVTALKPTVSITGISVSPNSDVETDFTSPVTYTVTAADGSTKDYTVTVNIAAPVAVTAPTFNLAPAVGLLTPPTLTITKPDGSTACYTTDGSLPTCNSSAVCTGTSTTFPESLLLSSAGITTYRIIACQAGITASSDISGTTTNSPGCFKKGVNILTAKGEIKIEEIKKGDLVYSYDEKNKKLVTNTVEELIIHKDFKDPAVILTLENNISLNATINHPFYSPKNGKYYELKEFKIGDKVLMYNKTSFKKIKIKSIIQQDYFDKEYNLALKNSPHNFFANDVVVHNKPGGSYSWVINY